MARSCHAGRGAAAPARRASCAAGVPRRGSETRLGLASPGAMPRPRGGRRAARGGGRSHFRPKRAECRRKQARRLPHAASLTGGGGVGGAPKTLPARTLRPSACACARSAGCGAAASQIRQAARLRAQVSPAAQAHACQGRAAEGLAGGDCTARVPCRSRAAAAARCGLLDKHTRRRRSLSLQPLTIHRPS
jgi:hypothetical protein